MFQQPQLKTSSSIGSFLSRKSAKIEEKPKPETPTEVRTSLDCASIAKKVFREKLGLALKTGTSQTKVWSRCTVNDSN